MANILYTNAIVYVDGAQLTQETDITVKRTSGSNPVNTVARGYSGESPGAAMVDISCTNAAPALAFELDPGKYMKTLSTCELAVFASGKTLTGKVFIYEDNFSHAVNTEAKLSFSARGNYTDWK